MSGTDHTLLIKRVVEGGMLDADASATLFGAIMQGRVGESELAAFLTAQSRRGPTVEEITGAARAMRSAMQTIDAPEGAIDLCGTGGDGHGTFNISTAVTFVAAAAGVPVAKHGNRGASSRAGAADVLEKLGAKIDLAPEAAEACLRKTGLCFLFAQAYHPAMKYVGPVRKALGIRTIFNLLGPVSNPARVKRQLLGVYSRQWLVPLAEVLAALGAEKAWCVHGEDGLDEITTTGITHVAMLESGKVASAEVTPQDADLPRATLAELKGGDAEANAEALRRLFDGERSAYRDIVLLNAAAALIVAGKTADLRTGVAIAAETIDSGSAKRKLEQFVEATRAA
jgi:anthranilate phosphoribosyltransferase